MIQVLDDHGDWRDDLVSDYSEDNKFGTRLAAEMAMGALLADTQVDDYPEWRVIFQPPLPNIMNHNTNNHISPS